MLKPEILCAWQDVFAICRRPSPLADTCSGLLYKNRQLLPVKLRQRSFLGRKLKMSHSRWRAFALAYVSMLSFALVFQGVPPVLPLIVDSLGLSHTQAGLLMSLFALPGIMVSLPGGILADTLGPKKVGIFALLLMAAGSLLAGTGTGFFPLAAGRLAAGMGAITLAIVAPQTITRWFDRSNVGSMMGILNTAMPVGTILVFNLFVRAGITWGWRVPILFTSAVSLLVLVLFWLLHPGLPDSQKPRVTGKRNVAAAVKSLPAGVWICALVWMAFNAAAISFLSFAADFFASSGHDAAYASFITSLFMAGALVLSFPVGYLTDRLGGEHAFIAFGSLAMALLLYLVPRTGASPVLLVALIGIAAALIPAPIFSLVPKLLTPDQTGTGYGVLSSLLNVGVLAGPFLVGMSYDQSGSYQYGFNLMAVFSCAAVVFVFALAKGRRDGGVDNIPIK
jgi:predicted MFS family arabinose efflux permease